LAVRLPQAVRPLWPEIKIAYTRATRVIAPVSGVMSRARGGRLPQRAVQTVDDCAAAGTAEVWVARPPEEVVRDVPSGNPPLHPVFVGQARELIPRVAVADIPGGRVLGSHPVVIDARGTLIQEFSTYWGTESWREHPIFWHPFPGPPDHVDGRLGVLATRGDVSYYHFLLDVLPRIGVLEGTAAPTPDRWYVAQNQPFQREILELAGVTGHADVVDSTTHPHVRADSLLVPGLPDTELRTPAWAVANVRERLLPAGLEVEAGNRTYVTRGSERNNRVVANEAEVVGLLADRGFTVIDPGTMPVAEQIQTFGRAECIVAPHGAALANLVFASPGASVVELFAPDYVQTCYWKLADGVPGLAYRYLVGVGHPRGEKRNAGVMSDITVDLDALAGALDSLDLGRV
jgi:hypothetical protein